MGATETKPALRIVDFRGGFPGPDLAGEFVDYFGAANFTGVR